MDDLAPRRVRGERPVAGAVERAEQDIEGGIAVVAKAIGDPQAAQNPRRPNGLER
jgi:hypothetical protein